MQINTRILHIQQIYEQKYGIILLVCFIRWIKKYVRPNSFGSLLRTLSKIRKYILKIFIHSLSWAALLRQMFRDFRHDSLFPEMYRQVDNC